MCDPQVNTSAMAAELGNVDEDYSATNVALGNGALDRIKEGYFICTFLS